MRRFWADRRRPVRTRSPERLQRLRRLFHLLSENERQRLRRLTGGLGRLGSVTDTDALDAVLLAADDADVDLLARCAAALLPDAGPDAPGGPDAERPSGRRRDRIAFRFGLDSPELGPFLASLRRNGLRAVVVERDDGARVFVEVTGASDLEVVRHMTLATSLRELVARLASHTLRGHRAGR